MRKLGKNGTHRLKAFHLIFMVMWMGGVMALLAVQLLGSPGTPEAMAQSAADQLAIDYAFLIPGGLGIIATSLLYPLLTNMGSVKTFWVRWKWVLTAVLTVIGAGYMGTTLKQNASYAVQAISEGSFDPSVYWGNVYGVAIAGFVQLVLFLAAMHLAITKPRGRG